VKILSDILKDVPIGKLIGIVNRPIQSISFDSREVDDQHLFVAVKGTSLDGHKFIKAALDKGATTVVCEEIPRIMQKNITYIKVKQSGETLGILASNFYNNPSSKIKIIGITGTNGKTTTATLLYFLFKRLGFKVGLLSTIHNYVDEKILDSTHTTPDPIRINSLLSDMVEKGCEFCFMEISSHALVQKRIAGLTYTGGIFTNIGHDHLDYHKTFDDYLKAKRNFFDNLNEKAFALINSDDRNAKIISQNTKAQINTYAIKSPADFKCRIIESHFNGMLLKFEEKEVWTQLIGDFNAYNILSVYACAILLGQKKEETLTAISCLKTVRARFEYFRSGDGINTVVDYAHTPDALLNVLHAINKIKNGNVKLITVVGAGGDRDKSKRPFMGKIVAELSNKVIFTSDNPRTEDPEDIVNDMLEGVEGKFRKKIVTIINRKEAIKTACLWAKKGDIILVAGKGHETYQEINGIKHHFNDKQILMEILNNLSC